MKLYEHMGWRASFGAIAIAGVIALLGILLFIPKLQSEQGSNMGAQLKALIRPKLLYFLLICALGNSSLFAVFTYIAPRITSYNVCYTKLLRGRNVQASLLGKQAARRSRFSAVYIQGGASSRGSFHSPCPLA